MNTNTRQGHGQEKWPDLDNKSVDQYNALGYVSPLTLFDPAKAMVYRSEIDMLIAHRPGPGIQGRDFYFHQRHLDIDVIWNICTDPRLIAWIRTLVGDEVILIGSRLLIKDPGTDDYIPWHQDITYMNLDPPQQTAVMYAVDDMTVANGCLRVVPRGLADQIHSHRLMTEVHMPTVPVIEGDLSVFEHTAESIELKAGQVAIFDGKVIHGSNANRSNTRRCGLIIRFAGGCIRPLNPTQWPAVLLQGAGKRCLFPTHTRQQALQQERRRL